MSIGTDHGNEAHRAAAPRRRLAVVGATTGRTLAVLAAVALLGGCYYQPYGYGSGYYGDGYSYYSATTEIGAPAAVFTFSDGVQGYYAPAYGAYVYGYGGYYYRWNGAAWLFTVNFGGPWRPLPPAFSLPPLLAFGPPPPVVAYRPYFIWWRAHMTGWYARYHPAWWARHREYIRHYALWHERVVHFYRMHPGARPRMRPLFSGRERPFNQRQNRFGPPRPGFGGPRAGFPPPRGGFPQPHPGFGGPRPGFGPPHPVNQRHPPHRQRRLHRHPPPP